MEKIEFQCVKIIFADYAKEIGALRRDAWKNVEGFDKNAFPKNEWLDDLDESAIHWAVFDKSKIIAAARLGIYSSYDEIPYMDMMMPYKPMLKLPVASLNRLVVSNKYRGNYLSQQLDKVRIEEAKKMKAKTIVGQAVSIRIIGLKNLGFEFVGNIGSIKELPNIELALMLMEL